MLLITPLTCFSRDSDSALNQHRATALAPSAAASEPLYRLGGRLHLNRLSTRKSLFPSSIGRPYFDDEDLYGSERL